MTTRTGLRQCLLLALAVLSAGEAQAQQAGERERAQIRQLQQQVQKLQQDTASLRRERDEASAKLGDTAKVTQELGAVRAGASAARRELTDLKGQTDDLRKQLAQTQSDLERARADIKSRDEALAAVYVTQRRFEVDTSVLGSRLKQQAARADLCEARHAAAWSTGETLLALYEKDRLRVCEPVTGLWRVREETRIQALRDRLLDARLELPPTAEAAPR